MVDVYNKDALLDEITRRVIQLDSQRQFDEELRKTVQAYIEALDEITSVAKPDIEAIAQQVINEYQQNAKTAYGLSITRNHIFAAGAVFLALLLFMAIFTGKYFGLKEGLYGIAPAVNANDSQVNNRAQLIRAKLVQAFNQTAPLKVAALEHYQTTLKFPATFDELGYKSTDFEDGDLIEHINFTSAGGILITLGKGFDANTRLLLQSDALENKAVFRWKCTTNIPQLYLGAASSAPCQFSETF
ncbi:MAG TPA: pilin [Cellvibrionaceae bacterium]